MVDNCINYCMNENNILNFTDALNKLNKIAKENFYVDAWVPSLERTIRFQEINAKQQKTIIESAIDSSVSKSTFSKIFYEILSSNCEEDAEVLKTLTIIDKNSIAFHIRSQISETINVIFSEDPKIQSDINILSILDKYKSFKHPENKNVTYAKNEISVNVILSIPKFYAEGDFDSYIYNKERKENNVDDIKNLITDAFIGETAKYIKSIHINDNDINYDSLHIPQKIQIVEKLPATLIQNILQSIMNIKNEINAVSEVSYLEYTKILEADSLIFISN